MTTHLARVAIPALLLLCAADGVLEMFGAHNSRAAWAGVDAALAAGRDEEPRPGDLGAACKRDDLGDWGA